MRALPVGGGGKRSSRAGGFLLRSPRGFGRRLLAARNLFLSLVRPHASCGPRAASVVGVPPASFRGGLPKALDGLNKVELSPAEPKSKRATIRKDAARLIIHLCRPPVRLLGRANRITNPSRRGTSSFFGAHCAYVARKKRPSLEKIEKSERRSHAVSPSLTATRCT